jgi:citrate lyase subunit beta/citryl-CoA lyase
VLEAAGGEYAAFRYEGRMIDEPMLRHARLLLARAGTDAARPTTPHGR